MLTIYEKKTSEPIFNLLVYTKSEKVLDVNDSVSHCLLFILFIHKKSLAIYRIADHTSIENIQRMMRTNPISYNTYEKMIHKERKEKSKHI